MNYMVRLCSLYKTGFIARFLYTLYGVIKFKLHSLFKWKILECYLVILESWYILVLVAFSIWILYVLFALCVF